MHAELDDSLYPTGIKISDTEIDALTTDGALNRHEFHGEWNYTPKPTTTE